MAKNDSYAGQLIDEIERLKKQIERMKNCENCETVRDVEGNCFYLKSGKCIKLSMWEMKE